MLSATHGLIVLGLVLEEDEILLTPYSCQGASPRWSLPGGAVRAGESPEAAAVRTVRRTTGYTVEPLGLLPASYLSRRCAGGEEVYEIILGVECQWLAYVDRRSGLFDSSWVQLEAVSSLALMPASWEFLWHVAGREGLPLPRAQPQDYAFIEFRRVDPAGQAHRYQLTYRIRPRERVPYTVDRLWGLVGGRLRWLTHDFPSYPQALDYLLTHCRRRIDQGYVITEVDEGRFPDPEWLETHRHLIRPGGQLRLF